MHTRAVIFERPGRLVIDQVQLIDPSDCDLVIKVLWSGISTGTERLLWSGDMPTFPGMGYPLVPGYETVGIVEEAPRHLADRVGEIVFVPGSSAYKDVRGLFGGAAEYVIADADKVLAVNPEMGEDSTLMALASTAHHALFHPIINQPILPDLIVGHGILGRLLARLTVALGGEPTVWETDPKRWAGNFDYRICHPTDSDGLTFENIVDVSGDDSIIDKLVAQLKPRGEIVLAGFYGAQLNFTFPPAFMKEARVRIAAEWNESDQSAVSSLIDSDRLSLAGLITHQRATGDAQDAYETAFNDPDCLKMVLNWSGTA
ncbi:MAG: chlorophyll synthesis pathway protein BchC [Rhizobiaceae bacterium]